MLPLTVYRADLPPPIHNRFPKVRENSAGSKITHVHSLVFGADGSYMLAWKGKDGKNYQGISEVYIKGFTVELTYLLANNGLPLSLTSWLDKKDAKGFLVRDVANLKLALGPENKSFFVTDGKDYLWQGLPAGLDAAIEKLRKRGGGFTSAPRLVSLGVKGSYVMITAGNGGSWNVTEDYPELDKFLDELKTANGNKGGMFASVSVCASHLNPAIELPL
jgi:hypothetical protein